MKVLIFGDSAINPRTFPAADRTPLEGTFPFQLKEQFPEATFYQLCFGNVTTEEPVGQIISYFSEWQPDFIIVLSGMADCKPEAYTEFERSFLEMMSRKRFFHRFAKFMLQPKIEIPLRRIRQKFRVIPAEFERTAKKLKLIFSDSRILWLEIFVSPEGRYEQIRPGITGRVGIYNNILKKVFGADFVPVQKALEESGGITADHEHLRAPGHTTISRILGEIMNEHSERKPGQV